VFVLMLLGWLSWHPAAAAGQAVGVTTGALNGRITDKTGAVLPGVDIVISSDALMGTRTNLTDGQGFYRFSVVPPGEYTLTFSLARFREVRREGVVVGLGTTTTIDVVLELADRQEQVVVTDSSPLIDRSSTALAARLDAQQLADLPASRSFSAILSATPSIQLNRFDVGGNTAFSAVNYGAYGTDRVNQPTIEGINVSGLIPLAFTIDYGTIEEVSVLLGAHSAEWVSPTVHVRIITKSGSNQYRSSVYADYENRSWQSFNVDADQSTRVPQGGGGLAPDEANRLWSYRDANADASGPFRKDRFWWYASFRDQAASARQLNFLVNEPVRTRATNLAGKTEARATKNSRLVLYAQTGWNHQPNRLDGYLRPVASVNPFEDSTTNQKAHGGVWKAQWNSLVRQRVVFEILAGQFIASRHERPNSTSYRFEDQDLRVYGGNRDWKTATRRDQVTGSASYSTRAWVGSHEFKLGGEIERDRTAVRWNKSYLDNVLHVRPVQQGGRQLGEVYLFQTPSKSEDGLQWYAAYVQDSWRLTDRVTFNLGLRFDRFRLFLPAQQHPPGQSAGRSWPGQTFPAVDNLIDWNVLVPRISLSLDLSGDGRTLFKLSYGKYWRPSGGLNLGVNANANSTDWWERFNWSDLNDDGHWSAGEELEPLGRQGGEASESLDPGLKLPFVREFTGRIERELVGKIGIETGIVWRGERQPFLRQDQTQRFGDFTRAVTVTDPGVDGVVGTPDDGPATVVYDLSAAPPPQSTYLVRNVPDARSDYLTWEVTARRRPARRWSLVAGFSHMWVREHASMYFGQSVRANTYALTPNDLINTSGDGRHEFRVWSARMFGTYEAPWGVRLTPFLRHQSGQPYGRTFIVNTPRLNVGALRVLAEPIGTRRMDHITLLDLRAEKEFRLTGHRRVSMFLDVFNVLNANPEQNINWLSGSTTFQSPLAIVPPRIARIGLKAAW
jgi:outer membrane receptor protein involved in Fe transport